MAKLIFAGTPDFSVVCLNALLRSEHQVVSVYTQPDRRAGRGRKMLPSPVKQVAEEAGIPVRQPTSFRDQSDLEEFISWQADLMIVVAYGLLLPEAILHAPRLGCVNVHASLLPRWRGAAPIQRAIEAGDKQSGVCIMQMDRGLDTGPVWKEEALELMPNTTGQELHDQLAQLGAKTLLDTLPTILAGSSSPVIQSEQGSCYARKLLKSDAWIDWSRPASELDRQVRAFNPVPVAQSTIDGDVLRIWACEMENGNSHQAPGTVVAETAQGIDVQTGDGLLRLLTLQPVGKKPMPVKDFINGRSLLGKCFTL